MFLTSGLARNFRGIGNPRRTSRLSHGNKRTQPTRPGWIVRPNTSPATLPTRLVAVCWLGVILAVGACVACSTDRTSEEPADAGALDQDTRDLKIVDGQVLRLGEGVESGEADVESSDGAALDSSDGEANSPGSTRADPATCSQQYWTDPAFSPLGLALAVVALPGGDIVMAGYRESGAGSMKGTALTRYGKGGTAVWSTLFANDSSKWPTRYAITADESLVYVGWEKYNPAPDKGGATWAAAALSLSGKLEWTQPFEGGRSVDVVCLARMGTATVVAGHAFAGLGTGAYPPVLVDHVLGHVSTKGDIGGVATLRPSPMARWTSCAASSQHSRVALVGRRDGMGWLVVRGKAAWLLNKTLKPCPLSSDCSKAGGSLWGVSAMPTGGYVVAGTAGQLWVMGLDEEGHERFNVSQNQFYDSAQGASVVGHADGRVSVLSAVKELFSFSPVVVLQFDRWGNRENGVIVGGFGFDDAHPNLKNGYFIGRGVIRLNDSALAVIGTREEPLDASGEFQQVGRIYHTDVWGYSSCEEAGKCRSRVFADCDDNDPCTRDTCKPQWGCVNVPWPDGTRCNVASVCKAGACVVK